MVFTSPEEGAKLVHANTQFALDLFKVLAESKKEDNIFLSPMSISTTLPMTYLGKAMSHFLMYVWEYPHDSVKTYIVV